MALAAIQTSENTSEITKLPKGSKNFTQYLNDATDYIAEHLDPYALMIWQYMVKKASINPNWDFKVWDIAKQTKIGRNTVYNRLRQFKKCGFVGYAQLRGERGRYGKSVYRVSQTRCFLVVDNVKNEEKIKSSIPAKPTPEPRDTVSRYTIKCDTDTIYNNNIESSNKSKTTTTNNNLLSAKPVPETPVVVVEENKISEEKKQEECYLEPRPTPSPTNNPPLTETNKNKSRAADGHGSSPPVEKLKPISSKIKTVIERVNPDKRKLIPLRTLQEFEDNFEADALSDIVIYSINNANRNVKYYMRKCLKKNAEVDPQKYWKKHVETETDRYHKENTARLERADKKREAKSEPVSVGIAVDNFDDTIRMLKDRLPSHSFRMWIEPLTCKDGILYAPNNFMAKRVQKNYGDLLKESIPEKPLPTAPKVPVDTNFIAEKSLSVKKNNQIKINPKYRGYGRKKMSEEEKLERKRIEAILADQKAKKET